MFNIKSNFKSIKKYDINILVLYSSSFITNISFLDTINNLIREIP